MENRIFKSIWTLSVSVLILFSLGFSQARAEVYPVDISHDTSGWHINPCPLPGIGGDTWRFTNSASDTVYLFIPVCVGKQSLYRYLLAPGENVDHLIDGRQWGVKLGAPPYGGIAECGRIHPPLCPTLTQWGTIALVAWLTIVTAWILSRRERRLV